MNGSLYKVIYKKSVGNILKHIYREITGCNIGVGDNRVKSKSRVSEFAIADKIRFKRHEGC